MDKTLYTKTITLFISLLASYVSGSAMPESTSHAESQTVLIINSYSENAVWARSLINPVSLYVANDRNLHAEMFSLNNVLVTDSATYNIVAENLFNTFKDKKPDYLVMIGALAFTLRDRVKENWGDIPILLISRELTLAPLNYFFAGYDQEIDRNEYPSISRLQGEYNFTTIYVPDLYKETIDMMVRLNPEMETLAFMSDRIFLNRIMAHDIQYYLYENYPDIKFRWVQASADRPDELQSYFVNRLPTTGMLLSTWIYEKTNAFGIPTLVTGDFNLLNSSKNPVFTTRQPNMSFGAIGGVFANTDSIRAQIIRVMDAMVAGERLSDIRFFTNKADHRAIIDYMKLKEYGLNENACPDNVVFVDKPPTFKEKYLWQIIATVIIFTLMVALFVRHINSQRKEIATLESQRNFVNKMPVPFSKAKVIYDDNGEVVNIKYMMYNEAFERLLKDNCYQSNPYRIFPNSFIAEKTRQLIDEGGLVTFKYHFEKTDTYYIFTLCIVDKKRLAKDRQDVIDIFVVDVTHRQKAENKLKGLTHKLDMTLNVAHLIPWEWDLNTGLLSLDAYSVFHPDANRTSQNKVSQIPIGEFIAQIHPDDRIEVSERVQKIISGEISDYQAEYRLMVTREGKLTEEWVEINATISEVDDDGKPKMMSGSLLVITDRKNQEKALIDARERATESDKLKSAFLANMSHEIRTPLNAIVGFSSLICETDDIAKRREFAEIIIHNNDMLLSLVNDVLDLAKIEANSLTVYPTPVNINTLLNTVKQTVQTRVHKGVELNVVEGLPVCVVITDGNRLSQVLMNLLTNAAKFTTKGSITFGYDLHNDKELYFFVKDTGLGISPENQQRLFKRFDKINNFMQGNGLGLSICKSIVEKLGGTIGMSSLGEGKGSTFWFTIPYTPDEDAIDNNISEIALSTEASSGSQTKEPAQQEEDKTDEGEKQTILVAEDMEGNYLLLQNLIPKRYRLLHAWDGQEALDIYRRCKPDLVLMDISMPVMDGYRATDEIRKIDAKVPIVAVTAFAYASDRQRILKSGFNDYISKPVNREELFEALKRYLGD